MARFEELWTELQGPGAPPHIESRHIKARVSAALDGGPPERRSYMKQKFGAVLLAAALIAAITGTAFAAARWDTLSLWFRGNTDAGQTYLDDTVRTASDENYSITVEGAAADESTVYLAVSVTALNDETKAFLNSDDFNSMDTFGARLIVPVERDGLYVSSFAYRELESETENCRRFAVDISLTQPVSDGTVFFRCGYMEKGIGVTVPMNPAPSLSVEIGASGLGVPEYVPGVGTHSDVLEIEKVTFSPFNCSIYMNNPFDFAHPHILLRMKDGTIRTQSQTLDFTGSSYDEDTNKSVMNYQFYEIQDLSRIASVIVFDREYPLDGSESFPVEHDPSLDPFTVTRMERFEEGGGYTVPVRELTEKLGGVFTQRQDGTVTCAYRDVEITLSPGSTDALVNGETVSLYYMPRLQDGVLVSESGIFRDHWGIEIALLRAYNHSSDSESGTTEVIWGDWSVVP